MNSKRGIQVGRVYTVVIENQTFEVSVISEVSELPDWWLCEAADGHQIIVPMGSLSEVAAGGTSD